MAKSYRPWAPTQSFLLPPSPLEWLEEGHLAYFVLDVVTTTLDLGTIEKAIQAKDWRGERPYSPSMMVALLIYAYCVGGVFVAQDGPIHVRRRAVSGAGWRRAPAFHDD